MSRKERIAYIAKTLDKLYPRALPGLQYQEPYTLLIAALLSAQCTDVRVNKVAPVLFTRAATPEQMMQLSVDEIEEIIRSCGLSKNKARSIASLSRILVKEHEGKVPESFEALERLPGVGHKTASIVMGMSFGHPAFPVDTHIHRLAQRWELTDGKNVKQTEADLKKCFAPNEWIMRHMQIILYGRNHCQARVCYGLTCDICKTCFPKRKNPVKTQK